MTGDSGPLERPRAGAKRGSAASHRALERVRVICLSLPETHEQVAWGEPTFRVRRKIFAMFADSHHDDGRIALWCKAPLGVQGYLVGRDPDAFFVPPYVGVKGWVGLVVPSIDDGELRELVVQSYCMIAPKRLAAAVDG